ncbi:phosphotriesterase [uncultured Demequina sp.]|uniref:phosphotriesterase family protein n=1 Tax=uncultured Demequina sp. TaxID=693499 RepID=UPI0025EE3FF1|nr:phosphotriesterase-related protein [uncultured Demequina sp.]
MSADARVPTYTGLVEPDALGLTLMHEHVFVGDLELDRALPHPSWDEQGAVDSAVETMHRLHERGVRTVVDLTVPGIGRNASLVARVAAASPVRIVAATGWYSVGDLPPAVRMHGPGTLVGGTDPLVELMVRDLEQGIAGTEVRAGVIKVASDLGGITPDVRRVFAAAAHAHRRTGAAIMTHSHAGSRGGIAQLELLDELEVAPDRVVVGHAGDSTDLDYLLTLAARGAYLGFDRFGMEHVLPDDARIRMLLAVLDAGLVEQVVLSHDAAVFSRVTPPAWRTVHAPLWHMEHLFETVLPRFTAAGVSDREIETMLVDTPRRLLSEAPRVAAPHLRTGLPPQ